MASAHDPASTNLWATTPSLEDTLASLLSSVRGVRLVVGRVVTARPLEVELIRGDGGWMGRRRISASPLRAVVEDGATLAAEPGEDIDPMLWPWDGAISPSAVAVPAGPSVPAAGMVLAWRPEGPAFTREERLRLEDLARVIGAYVCAGTQAAPPAGRANTDPLNSIVHELRTPLTVVSGYVAMMREGTLGELPEPAARALNIIATKTEEARLLIDELLTAGRLEADRIAPQIEVMDLYEAAAAAARRAGPRASMLGAELVADAPPQPILVAGDPHLVARVLDNLVNNALHYSSPMPRVELSVEADPAGGGILRVSDNGPGIREQMRERVFEKFVRADERGSRAGTGLGLYVGRQLADRLGGSLRLDSTELGVGTTFALRLPAVVEP